MSSGDKLPQHFFFWRWGSFFFLLLFKDSFDDILYLVDSSVCLFLFSTLNIAWHSLGLQGLLRNPLLRNLMRVLLFKMIHFSFVAFKIFFFAFDIWNFYFNAFWYITLLVQSIWSFLGLHEAECPFPSADLKIFQPIFMFNLFGALWDSWILIFISLCRF